MGIICAISKGGSGSDKTDDINKSKRRFELLDCQSFKLQNFLQEAGNRTPPLILNDPRSRQGWLVATLFCEVHLIHLPRVTKLFISK